VLNDAPDHLVYRVDLGHMSATMKQPVKKTVIWATRLSTVGNRAFLAAIARVWNDLPRLVSDVAENPSTNRQSRIRYVTSSSNCFSVDDDVNNANSLS